MEKISVIVPIYNVEKYLEKCINSIIAQTYKDIEVILVDDGSTDNSGKICYELAKKDSRIVVINKINEGVSVARNVGIESATGEYVIFVDADDYIEKDMIQLMYTELIKEDSDIVICGVNNVDIYYNIISKSNENAKLVLNNKQALKCMLDEFPYNNVCWGKLFKKELFDNYKFSEGIKIAEDLKLLYKIFFRCDKVVYLPQRKYNWLVREDSTIHKEYGPLWDDEAKICEEIIEFTKQNCLEVYDYAIKRYLRFNISCIKKIMKENRNSKLEKKHIDNLNKYKVKNIEIIPFKMKIKILLIKHFKILFKIIIKCKNININK